jgi:hypothetical protein
MIELRVQNENLRQVQRFFEEHSTPYRYLYELAPTGYHRKTSSIAYSSPISASASAAASGSAACASKKPRRVCVQHWAWMIPVFAA